MKIAQMLHLSRMFHLSLMICLISLAPGCALNQQSENTSRSISVLVSGVLESRTVVAQPQGTERAGGILTKNLNAVLQTDLVNISGYDLHIAQKYSGQSTNVSILVLNYSTVVASSAAGSILASRDGYFQDSIILIPYSFAVHKNIVVISFTEQSNSADAVAIVQNLPSKLVKLIPRS